MNTVRRGGVYGPVTDKKVQRSLHIFLAKPSSDNDLSREWQPTGEHIKLKNHKGGYFTDAFELSDELNLSGVQPGVGRGYATFQIEAGEIDDGAVYQIQKLQHTRVESIFVYRVWTLHEGKWSNQRVVTVWGYISTAMLTARGSNISIEIHVLKTDVSIEGIGGDHYCCDCVSGTVGEGQRKPGHMAPPVEGDVGENWGAPL